MKYSLGSGLVRQNCGWGAVVVGVDQSMCSLILTFPPVTAVRG